MALAEQKQAIIRAINAIEDERLLNIIARLIYGITNPKQNGDRGSEKAAETIQSIIK